MTLRFQRCAKVNFIWVTCYRYSDGMFNAELYNTELSLVAIFLEY